MVTALEQISDETREPAFDLVEPGGAGRGVVQGEAGMLSSQVLIAGTLWVP
jgi:hypothetical protein